MDESSSSSKSPPSTQSVIDECQQSMDKAWAADPVKTMSLCARRVANEIQSATYQHF